MYINDTDFLFEIIVSQGKGKLTNKAAMMIIKIANHLSLKFFTAGMDIKKDIIQAAILKMLEQYKNFDYKKYSSPFSYFTEIAKRAMTFQLNQLSYKKWGWGELLSIEVINILQ